MRIRLAGLTILSSLTRASCGGIENMISNLMSQGEGESDTSVAESGEAGGDAEESQAGEAGEGDEFPVTQEEGKTKLLELGETEGFQISFTSGSDEGDLDSEATYGMKGDMIWTIDSDGAENGVIKGEDGGVITFYYDTYDEKYYTMPFTAEEAGTRFEDLAESMTVWLYFGYQYESVGIFHRTKSTTYLGRAASEYVYSYSAYGVSANYTAVFDDEIGVTLSFDATVDDGQGNVDRTFFKITEFKTGDDVVAPDVPRD